MAITLYHHPFSRAANVVWMLEEIGISYELQYVDLRKGEQKSPSILALNPMGKLPILVDGDAVATESAAIGIYLADRYAPGRLAPPVDSPDRATYLRWSFFAPTVIEPCTVAKAAGWHYKPAQAGWGDHDSMLNAMESALTGRDYLLGSTFSMADVIFGGTVRFMLRFQMLEPRPVFAAYAERLSARPAAQRTDEIHAAIVKERGLAT